MKPYSLFSAYVFTPLLMVISSHSQAVLPYIQTNENPVMAKADIVQQTVNPQFTQNQSTQHHTTMAQKAKAKAPNVKVITIDDDEYNEVAEVTELMNRFFIGNNDSDNENNDEINGNNESLESNSTPTPTPTSKVPLNQISPDTLKTFVKVIDIVRKQYIEPVDDEKLFTYALQGMLKNLDEHAEFLDAQRYANLQAFTQGDLAEIGIDATFDKEQGNWVIQRVVPSSPADSAGVQAGFYLHQIDDRKLNEHTREHDVKQLLQGFAGSMVDIVVSNAGRQTHKLSLQRTVSTLTSIKVKMDRGIAIINIPNFQDNTTQEILDALVELNTPIYGVVLDLRDNPGGVLGSAINVASLFLPKSDVVQVENRQGEIQVLSTQGKAYLADVPVVVLQNRYSASASEVLASSLQYNKRATIIGETSYGKGTVQSVIPIDDGQAVKITVANYLRPNGSQIDGQGVRPDITLVSENHEKFYENLFNIVGQSTSNSNHKDLQQLNLASISADMRAKISNEMQWQKQAVSILLEQINYQHNNTLANMAEVIKHLGKSHLKHFPQQSTVDSPNKKAMSVLLTYPEEMIEEPSDIQDDEPSVLLDDEKQQ